jgi:predicted kinase
MMSEQPQLQPSTSACTPASTQATLVLLAGLSGSGKTTLALAIGKRLGWPVLDKDSVRSPLLELGAPEELAGQASYVVL